MCIDISLYIKIDRKDNLQNFEVETQGKKIEFWIKRMILHYFFYFGWPSWLSTVKEWLNTESPCYKIVENRTFLFMWNQNCLFFLFFVIRRVRSFPTLFALNPLRIITSFTVYHRILRLLLKVNVLLKIISTNHWNFCLNYVKKRIF